MVLLNDEIEFLECVDFVLTDLDKCGGKADLSSFYAGNLPDKNDVFTFLEENNCIKTHENRLYITPTGRMRIRKGGFAIHIKRERRNRNLIVATFIVALLSLIVGIISLCL